MSDSSLEPIKPLTGAEVAFCRVYAETGNMSEAYRAINNAVGIPETYCFTEGRKIYRRPEIRREIKRIEKQLANVKIDPKQIAKALLESLHRDMDDIYEADPNDGTPRLKRWDQIPARAKKLIIGIKKKDATVIDGIAVRPAEVEYKLSDRSADIDRLAKMLKLYDEKFQINIEQKSEGSDALNAMIYALIEQKQANDRIVQPLQIETKEPG